MSHANFALFLVTFVKPSLASIAIYTGYIASQVRPDLRQCVFCSGLGNSVVTQYMQQPYACLMPYYHVCNFV